MVLCADVFTKWAKAVKTNIIYTHFSRNFCALIVTYSTWSAYAVLFVYIVQYERSIRCSNSASVIYGFIEVLYIIFRFYWGVLNFSHLREKNLFHHNERNAKKFLCTKLRTNLYAWTCWGVAAKYALLQLNESMEEENAPFKYFRYIFLLFRHVWLTLLSI